MQTFQGMIVKSGDKYVLQDESTGKTYDIPGRIQGAIDPNSSTDMLGHFVLMINMIHIQPAR